MTQYEVQYARITTTGKIPDRFLNCQSKDGPDVSKAYMGTVYTLVEIISPWFTTSQVGQSIINTFSHAYYNGESTSDLDNFEEALKKVNENLAHITQNGETNWIGNLNAILAVQIDNKINLAQTGRAEVYIFRDGKTNHLTYGLTQNEIETSPLKTFSNITSGELKPRDKVLIANPDLFMSLSLETLREIISQQSPNESVLQIAKLLKKKKAKAVNVMIMELMTAEEASRIPTTNLSDNIHLDKPIETIPAHLTKFWQSILRPILTVIGLNLKKGGIKTYDLSKTGLQAAKNQVQKIKARRAEKVVTDDKFHVEFLNSESSDEGLLKDEEIQYSPELSVHYYEQEKIKKENKISQFLLLALDKLSRFYNWFISIWEKKKTRPYIFVGLAIIIILVLIAVISGNRHSSGSKLTLLQAQTNLKTAQADFADAKTATDASGKEKAKSSLSDCVSLTSQIATVAILKSDATNLNAQCQSSLDQLTSTSRFDQIAPVISASQDVKSAFVVGNQAFFMGPGDIYRSSLTGGTPAKVATLPKNNGDFQFGSVNASSIYLYTSAQKVFEYNADTNNLAVSKISGNWETANAANFYAGNLYLLDGIIGQIYKHTLTQGTFSAGQNYVSSSGVDLKNGVSLAIDGSVYALKSTGEALKLQSGVMKDFSFQGIPTPQSQIIKPVKIYTDSDTSFIYILDSGAKRVLEFDKDGHFIHQYALPSSLTNLTDMMVSIKDKKIRVLNAGSLYEIGI